MEHIIIPLRGLSSGVQTLEFRVGQDCIKGFGDNGVLDVDCAVKVDVEKRGERIGMLCDIEGYIVVSCDRCLEDIEYDVEVSERLTIEFVKDADEVENSDDSVLTLNEDVAEVNLDQCIYDFILLSLPLQKIHADGECNPSMVARIYGENDETEEVSGQSPFSGLKDLLNKKENN